MSFSKTTQRRNLSVSGLKKALEGVVNLNLNGWEILGDVMVVQLSGGYPLDERKFIGEEILKRHPKARVIVNRILIGDEYREPQTEILAGDGTETIHRENGVRFKLDPTKVMFSFGNKEERKRMASISNEEEIVVDMFSCVGQFALPIAKHSKPELVVAIEKNPRAHEYLDQNIGLNKLRNVKAVLGDCREVSPKKIADRVVMGYLFDTRDYLPTALQALRKKGVIHYHFLSTESRLSDHKDKVIKTALKESFNACVKKTVKVKSYAPKMYHWVFDLEVESLFAD